jgi:FkbM family methyltransferase
MGVKRIFLSIKSRIARIAANESNGKVYSEDQIADILRRAVIDRSSHALRDEMPSLDCKVDYVKHYFNNIHEQDYLIFAHFVNPLETVLDIGANGGYSATSIWAAGSRLGVISFEPIASYESMFVKIKENCGFPYEWRMIGLSDKPGQIEFYMPVINGVGLSAYTRTIPSGYSLSEMAILAQACCGYARDIMKAIPTEFHVWRFTAEVSTIDAVVANGGFAVSTKTIAAIKIDAEGHDPMVLKGGLKTIKSHKPLVMLEHPNNESEAMLASLDYVQVYRHGNRLSLKHEDRDNKYNFFYLSKNKLPYYESIGLYMPTFKSDDLFQENYYRSVYPNIEYAGKTPLQHYREIGWKEGKNPNPFLYSSWYHEKYQESAHDCPDPMEHYYFHGAALGYDPSPRFSTKAYAALHPESATMNPLLHYFRYGIREGRHNIMQAAAERVIGNRNMLSAYPENERTSRELSCPFIVTIASNNLKAYDSFSDTVQVAYENIVKIFETIKNTRSTPSLSPVFDEVMGRIDFTNGADIVHSCRVLKSYGHAQSDNVAQAYLLSAFFRVFMDTGAGEYSDIFEAIPEGWREHPVTSMALCMLALELGNIEDFKKYYAKTDLSYLGVYCDMLAISHYEAEFAAGRSVKIQNWYIGEEIFCYDAFDKLECSNSFGTLFASLCCGAIMPYLLNSPSDKNGSIGGLWTSSAAREIWRSVRDGDYSYCNRQKCWVFNNGASPSNQIRDYTAEDFGMDEYMKRIVSDGPVHVSLSLDRTCNLKCPSCRTNAVHPSSKEIPEIIKFYDSAIHPMLRGQSTSAQESARGMGTGGRASNSAMRIQLDGSGEAIISQIYRHIFRSIVRDHCDNVHITLLTNAQALDENMWNGRLAGINRQIDRIMASIDGATKETYEKLRYPGKWDRLCSNMDFIHGLLVDGKIEFLQINFCLQNDNWHELTLLCKLAKKWGVSGIRCLRYLNIANYAGDQMAQFDVMHPKHRYHHDAMNIIKEADDYCRLNNIIFYARQDSRV